MIFKRITAANYKTYLSLDLDLTVYNNQPIILIGGQNGGGKTTLFDAICSALYGLKIKDADEFDKLFNAGNKQTHNRKIMLKLHFAGMVLAEEKDYIITRTYTIATDKTVRESVELNLGGNIFRTGSGVPASERNKVEAEINKIIKANLPKELSEYFLFDAMRVGDLVKENVLNRVIRHNIENVLGFDKYLQLGNAAEKLLEKYKGELIEQKEEQHRYNDLIAEKDRLKKKRDEIQDTKTKLNEFIVEKKAEYNEFKNSADRDKTIRNKITQIENQIADIAKQQKEYHSEIEKFSREFEAYVALPRLAQSFKEEISLIIETKKTEQQSQNIYTNETLGELLDDIEEYLKKNDYLAKELDKPHIVASLIKNKEFPKENTYNFLESNEIRALENLINNNYSNPFPLLDQQRFSLNMNVANINKLKEQIKNYKKDISGTDYSFVNDYENKLQKVNNLNDEVNHLNEKITTVEEDIHKVDIQEIHETTPKIDMLNRLSPFFKEVANTLLQKKRQRIEIQLCEDLNINILPYKNTISRVELSDNLSDLNFKIYHKAGNEIHLSTLNTASKQILVQCLLKALHEFGDYDPPVMIDTVMGVLDEESRETVLENYFPKLSHQTILLGSNSEIRKNKDLEKIRPFVSRVYTLHRDIEKQKTDIIEDYFGEKI